jgi:ribosomal protein S27E
MANTKIVNEVPDDFDPFRWRCDACGKEQVYTEEEIEKTKKSYPDPQNHPYDFYISCPFCGKGIMEPPELTFFGGSFEDFNEE